MTLKEFENVAGSFAHDTDLLGAAQRLWDRGVAISEAKLALATYEAPVGNAARDLLVGDMADATLALEQQLQEELVNLAEKAIEWLPKMVALIVAAV